MNWQVTRKYEVSPCLFDRSWFCVKSHGLAILNITGSSGNKDIGTENGKRKKKNKRANGEVKERVEVRYGVEWRLRWHGGNWTLKCFEWASGVGVRSTCMRKSDKSDDDLLMFNVCRSPSSFVLLSSSSPSPKPSSFPIPSGLAKTEREFRMTFPVGLAGGGETIGNFRLGLIKIRSSSAISKVRYIERLNYQPLIRLG